MATNSSLLFQRSRLASIQHAPWKRTLPPLFDVETSEYRHLLKVLPSFSVAFIPKPQDRHHVHHRDKQLSLALSPPDLRLSRRFIPSSSFQFLSPVSGKSGVSRDGRLNTWQKVCKRPLGLTLRTQGHNQSTFSKTRQARSCRLGQDLTFQADSSNGPNADQSLVVSQQRRL